VDVNRSELLDEPQALVLLKSGDRRGVEALLELHQKEVYNVALRMLGEPAAAQDAAQDALLRAFMRIDLYRLAPRDRPQSLHRPPADPVAGRGRLPGSTVGRA